MSILSNEIKARLIHPEDENGKPGAITVQVYLQQVENYYIRPEELKQSRADLITQAIAEGEHTITRKLLFGVREQLRELKLGWRDIKLDIDPVMMRPDILERFEKLMQDLEVDLS